MDYDFDFDFETSANRLEHFEIGKPSRLANMILRKPDYGMFGKEGGALMHVAHSGTEVSIYHLMPNVSETEAFASRKGPLKLYLGEAEGLLFMVMENMAGRIDMTYEPCLEAIADRKPVFNAAAFLEDKALRMPVMYHLFDSVGGITKALRYFTMTNRMSYLFQKMAEEKVKGPPVSMGFHVDRLRRINQKYPRIKDLISQSVTYTRWDAEGESGA